MSIERLFKSLPGLRTSQSFVKTSEPDSKDPNGDPPYNCVAHAMDDKTQHWWPKLAYWPRGAPCEVTMPAFIETFVGRGFTLCQNGEYENGLKKICIYANAKEEPRHVALQMRSGLWSSKAGPSYDFSHDLVDLEGEKYGKVAKFMSKPR
jgi:hypothetical protein